VIHLPLGDLLCAACSRRVTAAEELNTTVADAAPDAISVADRERSLVAMLNGGSHGRCISPALSVGNSRRHPLAGAGMCASHIGDTSHAPAQLPTAVQAAAWMQYVALGDGSAVPAGQCGEPGFVRTHVRRLRSAVDRQAWDVKRDQAVPVSGSVVYAEKDCGLATLADPRRGGRLLLLQSLRDSEVRDVHEGDLGNRWI
jgi:hypothetical protein